MIVYQLYQELTALLPKAEEVYFAVALAKEKPLSDLLSLIPEQSIQKIIVGLDLPTEIEALQLLKDLEEKNNNIKVAIHYDKSQTFHPKLYLIKSEGRFVAFIGSANLTEPGLTKNIELSYGIDNEKDCEELLNWFKKTFSSSYPIDDHNIEEYKKNDDPKGDERGSNKKPLNLRKPVNEILVFDDIDFSDRFFRREHHWAFRKELWLNNSLKANKERQEAENRFIELHKLIYPRFYEFGLIGIHPNKEGHIVSLNHQINESAPRKLDAMWLSYGKSQADIKEYQSWQSRKEDKEIQTFIHHARIQIRIEFMSIGIWILFGKNNKGSTVDRSYFKSKMREVDYRKIFFEKLQSLPENYWIRINDDARYCNSFAIPEELHTFCKTDNVDVYFIIGRDYNISDDEMSELNLPNTTLDVFKKLFPIYELMRHKL